MCVVLYMNDYGKDSDFVIIKICVSTIVQLVATVHYYMSMKCVIRSLLPMHFSSSEYTIIV